MLILNQLTLHLCDYNGIGTHNHLIYKGIFNRLAKLAKWLSCFVSTNLYGSLTVCVFFFFMPHTCLDWIYTLVSKGAINHLAKLSKQLNCVVSTYLHDTLTVSCYRVTCMFRVNLHSHVTCMFRVNLHSVKAHVTW